ncbi:MAG: DNA primase [Planctomycetes bacterium]|nr:DNA primase [Planctomycetota bacterium]
MSALADRDAEKQLIKSRVRLDALARDLAGCELEPRGPDDSWACCPFHHEDTPSFHVRPRLGLYKCFGCGASGDAFSFVMQLQGIGFREALELLAERAGVTLGSMSPEERRRQADLKRSRTALTGAADVFREALRAGRSNPARAYMEERGFRPEVLDAFDVGFIPGDFLARLRQAGLTSAEVDAAGFTRAFGGRVGFGIRDASGALVGFGARTLVPGEKPKYVNTRETSAFNKRRLLYGLDKAARTVAKNRRVLVMEGYTDVMMAHQRGLSEAVATMGTSLTEDHLRLLRTRAPNLVFVMDGDSAGLDGAERAVRLALAQGLESRVLVLPDGADPCDWLGRHDAEAFEQLLAGDGVGTVSFLCRRALAELDPGQPGGREQVAREVLALCDEIKDPLRRQAIVNDVARECALDRDLLARVAGVSAPDVGRASRPAEGRRAPPKATVRCQFVAVAGLATAGGRRAEIAALRDSGAIDHPGARRLLDLGLELSGDPVDAQAWREVVTEREPALLAALERSLFPPPEAVLESFDEAVEHLGRRLESELESHARRAAIARTNISQDEAAIRALDSSLRARSNPPRSQGSPTTSAGPRGGPDPARVRPPSSDRPDISLSDPQEKTW